jgi:phosphoglycolate phosphatase-like HAD superfamily hydrolase
MTTIICQDILFDLDGTLVDTRESIKECYRRVLGHQVDGSFMVDAVTGHDIFAMRPIEVFALIAPDKADSLFVSYQENYPKCKDYIKVFPGIADLMNELVERRRRLRIVTNKGLDRCLLDLSVAGIPRSTFAVIVSAEDTIERKPDPAPILLGLKRAGATAAEAVYVGDGPQDILAAKAAGTHSIGITYGFYESDELEIHQPTALVDSVARLATVLGLQSEPQVDT